MRLYLGTTCVVQGEFLCLTVVGAYMVALGIKFGNCGSLQAPVPVVLVSLVIGI